MVKHPKGLKKFNKTLCLFSVLFLVSCDYIFPSTWNYRITVEIETPEGIKTGSTVRQIRGANTLALNPDVPSFRFNVSGEAVVVDLGKRGYVFALIAWNSYEEFLAAFPSAETDISQKIKYYKHLQDGTKEALSKNFPRFVTFADVNDPMTVKGIDREAMYQVLGKGVTLKAVTIEKTSAPVTRGTVNETLPWLNSLGGKNLDGSRGTSSNELTNVLHAGNFRRGQANE